MDELELIMFRETSQLRKTNVAYFLLHAEYRFGLLYTYICGSWA